MDQIDRDLRDAGCDAALAERLAALVTADDRDGALRLLRCHRCQLVNALHEAQRPIDVCDWLIHRLEKQVA